MLKRCLLVLVSVLGIASAASAISLAIVPDQATYLPGQTVTLTVTVDVTGGIGNAAFGAIAYDPSILLGGSSSQGQLTSFGGAIEWVLGFLTCEDGTCFAFSQIPGNPLPVDQGAGFVISTMTFTAGAVGTTNIEWIQGGPFDPIQFELFGLTDPPGTVVQVVPEPATAALLALGLAALASKHRRNS